MQAAGSSDFKEQSLAETVAAADGRNPTCHVSALIEKREGYQAAVESLIVDSSTRPQNSHRTVLSRNTGDGLNIRSRGGRCKRRICATLGLGNQAGLVNSNMASLCQGQSKGMNRLNI